MGTDSNDHLLYSIRNYLLEVSLLGRYDRYIPFLWTIKIFKYTKSYVQHSINCNQLFSGNPYNVKIFLLCTGICVKRYCIDYFVGYGIYQSSVIFSSGSKFHDLFPKWYVRIYQLEEERSKDWREDRNRINNR